MLQADVTDEAGVVVALAEVEKCFGGVDYIVNNAGKQIERDLLDTTNEDWETIEATNVRGPFWVCKHGAAAMLRLGRGGSIVNVASVLSICADPMLTAYTTSKHAVLGLTRSIAVTRPLARAGIRANAVLPGDMDTPMVQQYFAAHEDPEEARRQISSCYPVERIADPCRGCPCGAIPSFRRRIVCQRRLDRRRRRTGRCALHQSLIRPRPCARPFSRAHRRRACPKRLS